MMGYAVLKHLTLDVKFIENVKRLLNELHQEVRWVKGKTRTFLFHQGMKTTGDKCGDLNENSL